MKKQIENLPCICPHKKADSYAILNKFKMCIPCYIDNSLFWKSETYSPKTIGIPNEKRH